MKSNSLLLVLILVAAPFSAYTEALVTCDLQAEKNSISLGEPLFLTLSCRNDTASEAQIDLATGDGLLWIISRTDGATDRIPEKARLSRPSPQIIPIPGGKEMTARVPLGRWFRFPEGGTYQVAALIRPLGKLAGVETNAIEIVVEGRSPGRLRATAEQLLQTAADAPSAEAELAAEALASIEDPLVLPFFAEALHQRIAGTAHIVDGLARMGNRESILILVDAFDKADPFDRLRIQERLRDLAAGIQDSDLRKRADQIVRGEAIRLVPNSL